MAAVSGYLHLQYSSKDIFTISLLQVASAWTAVAVSNYTLPRVSLISNTARSLRIFCLVFSLLSFTLLRFKSKVKFTVSCFDLDLILSVLNWVFFVEVEISRGKFTLVLTLITYWTALQQQIDACDIPRSYMSIEIDHRKASRWVDSARYLSIIVDWLVMFVDKSR